MVLILLFSTREKSNISSFVFDKSSAAIFSQLEKASGPRYINELGNSIVLSFVKLNALLPIYLSLLEKLIDSNPEFEKAYGPDLSNFRPKQINRFKLCTIIKTIVINFFGCIWYFNTY